LAKILGVPSQEITRVVKGNGNLTLEAIYKLSKALGAELISFPQYRYHQLKETKEPSFSGNAPLQQALASPATLSKLTRVEVAGTGFVNLNSKANDFA